MILLQVVIEGIRTRKDNTLVITLGCNELPASKAGEVMALHGKYAYMALKPENFTKLESDMVAELKVDESIGKTRSQQLRGVLYRNWEQNPEGYKTANLHYDGKMEEIINHLKKKLI